MGDPEPRVPVAPSDPAMRRRAIADCAATYASGATRPLSWRREQLARLRRLVTARRTRAPRALLPPTSANRRTRAG